MFEIHNFISKFLGEKYTDPPNFDWTKVLKTTKKSVSNILLMGGGINAYDELKFTRTHVGGLGHIDIVYQPLGTIDNDRVARMIV